MIAIVIGIVAAITLNILFKKEAKNEKDDWFVRGEKRLAIFMVCLLTFAIDSLAWAIYSTNVIETTQSPEIVASVDLVALQDNSSAAGSFFLGSGSLSNNNYYAFYYETDHGYKYETIDAESRSNPVYIKYIPAEETPRIDRYALVEGKTMTADGGNAWLFSIIAWLQYGRYNPSDILSEETTGPALLGALDTPNYYDNWRYEIFIPEGSIKTNYAIDLE